MRAEFSAATRRLIAERAGYQCSVLNCGRLTIGPGATSRQTVSKGMAAHIFAASPTGPRGAGGLSAAGLSEPENGIWCCYDHGKVIDSDEGRVYSATQLKAWKRLHEARKAAEVNGGTLDHIGLVESISINAAPLASLEGRKFDLDMRNIITGPNESGKTILTRLIASVAYPDHVAEMSRERDVDMAVCWFDPLTHNVTTQGRGGEVRHILDGVPVPYVARPFKTILLTETRHSIDLGDIISLAQAFDLSISAMKAMIELLVRKSSIVRDVHFDHPQVQWTTEVNGRKSHSSDAHRLSASEHLSILLELAGIHARHHARVEPTFLILDGFMDFWAPRSQIAALELLEQSVGDAQVAIVSHSPPLVGAAASSNWRVTELEPHRPGRLDSPVDFDVSTSSIPFSSD